MSQETWPSRVTEPEEHDQLVRFAGAGAADPTILLGRGVTVRWISTGLYEVTWPESQGAFAGYAPGFQATTAADLKGYSCVAGDYNATTRKLRVSVTSAGDALVDLTATQKLNLRVAFKQTGA